MNVSYRQGDIYLKKVEHIPETDGRSYNSVEGEEIKKAIILAHGESTGHKHAIYDGNALLVKDKNSDKFFLMVLKNCELKHEEHDTIKLPTGNYEVIRQREYSPTEIRRVAD